MIVADWGTTNLRVYACDEDGSILDRVESDQGIKSLTRDDYPGVLRQTLSMLQEPVSGPLFVCGMASSRNGWIETDYCGTPLAMAALAEKLVRLPSPFAGYILPGASSRLPDGTRDVMRGEEIQIFGTMSHLGCHGGVLCLPGTHSKWVRLEDGMIAEFATFLTGDLFQALSQSILACDIRAPYSQEAFSQGLQAARNDDFGLLHRLFAARTRVLDGVLEDGNVSAFVSGLLIGHELAEVEAWRIPGEVVTIVGAGNLCRRYGEALASLGVRYRLLDSSVATCAGVAALRRLLP